MNRALIIYRLYDIADQIHLHEAEKLLSQSAPVSRLRLARVSPKAIAFKNAPITVNLSSRRILLGADEREAQVRARIYDFGVVSVILQFSIPDDTGDSELVDMAVAAENLPDTPFESALSTVLDAIVPALSKQHEPDMAEDLLLFYFREWNDQDPVPLLLADKSPISADTRREVLSNRFSYSDDFTILTWDKGLIFDPSGSPDIPDLLEFATAQLLELRYYDRLLEDEIEKVYTAVAEASKGAFFRKLGKYRLIRRQLLEQIADITQITGRVRNALRITEDVFYAKVYTAYLRIIRERDWEDSIHKKITVLQNSYSMLNDEVVTHRAELMEMAILLLIAIEIFLSLGNH